MQHHVVLALVGPPFTRRYRTLVSVRALVSSVAAACADALPPGQSASTSLNQRQRLDQPPRGDDRAALLEAGKET
jgi:hypothetical protein